MNTNSIIKVARNYIEDKTTVPGRDHRRWKDSLVETGCIQVGRSYKQAIKKKKHF